MYIFIHSIMVVLKCHEVYINTLLHWSSPTIHCGKLDSLRLLFYATCIPGQAFPSDAACYHPVTNFMHQMNTD